MKQVQQAERRILSVWLPDWPVYRLARARHLDPVKPLALRAARQGDRKSVV